MGIAPIGIPAAGPAQQRLEEPQTRRTATGGQPGRGGTPAGDGQPFGNIHPGLHRLPNGQPAVQIQPRPVHPGEQTV